MVTKPGVALGVIPEMVKVWLSLLAIILLAEIAWGLRIPLPPETSTIAGRSLRLSRKSTTDGHVSVSPTRFPVIVTDNLPLFIQVATLAAPSVVWLYLTVGV